MPPCGESFKANERFRLYYCAATRNHRKAKYLGIYAKKTVRAIGQIAKVATCTVNLDTCRVSISDGGCTLTREEEKRIVGTTEEARARGWDIRTGEKFYLCDAMEGTDFRKTLAGGIFGHRYFDLQEVLGSKPPQDLSALAALLRKQTWK